MAWTTPITHTTGYVVLATDWNQVISNLVALHDGDVGSASEVGYDQVTSTVNVSGTTSASPTTVVPGSSHFFDGTPHIMEFYAPIVQTPNASTSSVITIGLYEAPNLISQLAQLQTPAAATLRTSVYARQRMTPNSGTHTFSAQAWANVTTGTPAVVAGAGSGGAVAPCYLRFIRV